MSNHETPTPPRPEDGNIPTPDERFQAFKDSHPDFHFGDGPAPAGTKFHIKGLESNSNVTFGDGASQVVNMNPDGSGDTTTHYPDGVVETNHWAGAEGHYDDDAPTPEASSNKGSRMGRLLSKMGRSSKGQEDDQRKEKRGRGVSISGVSGVIIGSGKAYENGVDVSDQRVVETRPDGLYLNGKRIQKF